MNFHLKKIGSFPQLTRQLAGQERPTPFYAKNRYEHKEPKKATQCWVHSNCIFIVDAHFIVTHTTKKKEVERNIKK